MIAGILDDYLTNINSERALDEAFEMLLRAMEFESVKRTHGTIELGRDFIAQKSKAGELIQHSFQLKKGKIGQPEWRGDVLGQVTQALTSKIQHPSFDMNLRHQVVLVTSGKLTAAANLAVESFNQQFVASFDYLPLEVWDKDDLIGLFDRFGLTGQYQLAAGDLSDYSEYLGLYSSALAKSLDTSTIEQFSMRWVNAQHPESVWNLWVALETETMGRACYRAGLLYEELFFHMCRIRSLIGRIFYGESSESLSMSLEDSLSSLVGKMLAYSRSVSAALSDCNGILSSQIRPKGFVTYPILCSRFIEITSLVYLLSIEPAIKVEALQLLELLIDTEPGCAHPISDRYAIPIASTSLALAHAGKSNRAKSLVTNTAIWICDRFEHGLGIASVDANVDEEVQTLLGTPFEGVDIDKRKSSLTATILLYIAQYLGDDDLLLELTNDFDATNILAEYYCIPDSDGAIRIDSDQIRFIPSVHFEVSEADDHSHPQHQSLVPPSFRFAVIPEIPIYWILSVIMRDRFFPTLWEPKAQRTQLDSAS